MIRCGVLGAPGGVVPTIWDGKVHVGTEYLTRVSVLTRGKPGKAPQADRFRDPGFVGCTRTRTTTYTRGDSVRLGGSHSCKG